MIAPHETLAGGPAVRRLKISAAEALDAAKVARIVSLKNQYTAARAAADAEVIAVENRHQLTLTTLADKIAEAETEAFDYCAAHRDGLFCEKKSRETALAVFGFELTPPRVETSSRRIAVKDVVTRLLRLTWGRAYVRQAAPALDKNALLADRERLTDEQCLAAGIQFLQDEQFFIRPKPETAETRRG